MRAIPELNRNLNTLEQSISNGSLKAGLAEISSITNSIKSRDNSCVIKFVWTGNALALIVDNAYIGELSLK